MATSTWIDIDAETASSFGTWLGGSSSHEKQTQRRDRCRKSRRYSSSNSTMSDPSASLSRQSDGRGVVEGNTGKPDSAVSEVYLANDAAVLGGKTKLCSPSSLSTISSSLANRRRSSHELGDGGNAREVHVDAKGDEEIVPPLSRAAVVDC